MIRDVTRIADHLSRLCADGAHENPERKMNSRCWGLTRTFGRFGAMAKCPCECHLIAEASYIERGEEYRR